MGLDVNAVYRDAWQIYRLLFRRSVLTAAIVFLFAMGLDVAGARLNEGQASSVLFGLASFLIGVAAPVFVQGALIELVRDIHEGRPAKRVGALVRRTRNRLLPLLGASLLYGLVVIVGLILLIVPGLIVAARWALMAPFVVLENEDVGTALQRSSDTVRGETSQVLWIVVATYVLVSVPYFLIAFFLPGGYTLYVLATFAWSSLSAPFEAHVLTVLFYRLTDPERPVIHDDVFGWPSVWRTA